MTEQKEPERLSPSLDSVCLALPLYYVVDLRPEDEELLGNLRLFNFQIDAHCLACERDSIFKTRRPTASAGPRPSGWEFRPATINAELFCQRCNLNYRYIFRVEDFTLQKIGQFPSLEDIAGADLNRFRKILDRQDFSELHRAGGLASHGIGIGSFVYLRRIFERLISKAKAEAIESGDPLHGFDGMRMEEKIGALHAVLPRALVNNRATYGILSLGLHQLDERTCLEYFPVVRAAIMQMLEQHLMTKAARDAESALELEIQKISGSLKSGEAKTK
jgi:hypothetical protein